MLDEFMSSLSPNNRPQQQSSPSDQSMSTSTPPHQSVSRASPASTALVMSSNNIHHQQLASNTNTNSNSSPSNVQSSHSNSPNSAGSSTSNQQQHQHPQHLHGQIPPHPMVRQFACHAKSMSAGVVVSVPGISNNLAMNQNNMVNNNLIQQQQPPPAPHHHHHHSRHPSGHAGERAGHHHQLPVQQHVIREHRNHSSATSHQSQLTANNQPTYQIQPQPQQQQGNPAPHSSIILTQNNLHNRSASAHLSNVIMASHQMHQQQHHHHHHHPAPTHHQSSSVSNNHLNHSRQHFQHSGQQITDPNNNNIANSIWSIGENLSKSHNKLASSNYLPDPYLYGNSMNDLSCDNLSNISRLMDQPNGPAPAYFDIHPPKSNNLKKKQQQQQQQQQQSSTSLGRLTSGAGKQAEFLPICDLIFNLISMIIYFCENTFAIIYLIALYYHTNFCCWALIGATFVIASNAICQYLSYKWSYHIKLDECHRKQEAEEELEMEEGCDRTGNARNNNATGSYYPSRNRSTRDSYHCGSCAWLPDRMTEIHLKFLLSTTIDLIIHIFCLGFLIRYIKLVIPVTDTASVKREARDLCLLRMIHGFVQSAPLLLVQAFMIYSQVFISSPITSLNITAAILSLLNVCWALASFTKYARKKYLHKFVLTWLGIISQLLWRLGTISSRVVALTIYAVYYNYWALVVLALHWLTMFFWFIKPGNLLRDEVNLKPAKKISFAAAVAWVHCFCYVNFEELNSKLRVTTFYLIMFLENNLLLTVCLIFSPQVTWFKNLSILVVYLGFVIGMLSMFIYYKHFHVNILNNGMSCSQESIDSIADQLSPAGKKIAGFKPGTLRTKRDDNLSIKQQQQQQQQQQQAPGHRYHSNISGSQPEITRNTKPPYLTHNTLQAPLSSGVFSCKLNTTIGSRKQKMPSSHVRRHNS